MCFGGGFTRWFCMPWWFKELNVKSSLSCVVLWMTEGFG